MRKSFEGRQNTLYYLGIYLHNIANAQNRADVYHIVFAFEKYFFVVEDLFPMSIKYSSCIGIYPLFTKNTHMVILEIVSFQLIYSDDFISQQIVLTAIEDTKFCFLIIFKSLMPIQMIRIDIEENTDVVGFFEIFEHIARYLECCVFVLL